MHLNKKSYDGCHSSNGNKIEGLLTFTLSRSSILWTLFLSIGNI